MQIAARIAIVSVVGEGAGRNVEFVGPVDVVSGGVEHDQPNVALMPVSPCSESRPGCRRAAARPADHRRTCRGCHLGRPARPSGRRRTTTGSRRRPAWSEIYAGQASPPRPQRAFGAAGRRSAERPFDVRRRAVRDAPRARRAPPATSPASSTTRAANGDRLPCQCTKIRRGPNPGSSGWTAMSSARPTASAGRIAHARPARTIDTTAWLSTVRNTTRGAIDSRGEDAFDPALVADRRQRNQWQVVQRRQRHRASRVRAGLGEQDVVVAEHEPPPRRPGWAVEEREVQTVEVRLVDLLLDQSHLTPRTLLSQPARAAAAAARW